MKNQTTVFDDIQFICMTGLMWVIFFQCIGEPKDRFMLTWPFLTLASCLAAYVMTIYRITKGWAFVWLFLGGLAIVLTICGLVLPIGAMVLLLGTSVTLGATPWSTRRSVQLIRERFGRPHRLAD